MLLFYVVLVLFLPDFLTKNVVASLFTSPGPAVMEMENCRSVNLSNAKDSNSKRKEITFGLLIPYNFSSKVERSTYDSGLYYASAVEIALDKINKDPDILPDYCLNYVWNNTGCLEQNAIRAQDYQLHLDGKEHAVNAFIGPGCHCNTVAKVAGALNIPIISHVSKEHKHFKFEDGSTAIHIMTPPPPKPSGRFLVYVEFQHLR